jgi:hypothetical protein
MIYKINNDKNTLIIGRGIDKLKYKNTADLIDDMETEDNNFNFRVFQDLYFDDIMDVREEYINLMGKLRKEEEMPPDATLLPFVDEPYYKFLDWVKLRKRKIKLNRVTK